MADHTEALTRVHFAAGQRPGSDDGLLVCARSAFGATARRLKLYRAAAADGLLAREVQTQGMERFYLTATGRALLERDGFDVAVQAQ